MRFEFLPPYSPDFNPIELAFSAMKHHLRRDQLSLQMATEGRDDADVYAVLNDAIFTVTPNDAAAWFHKCQYL
jgi:cytochrome c oxidase assembly protein Cox11